MFLSDRDIIHELQQKNLIIEPEQLNNIEPSSIDLRLGYSFKVLQKHTHLSIDQLEPPKEDDYLVVDGDSIVVHRDNLILASTLERVELPPNMLGSIYAKSSISRMGLQVDTASLVDPGYKGVLTLILSTITDIPVRIYAGHKICQLALSYTHNPAQWPYGDPHRKSKYQDSEGPTQAKTRK